MRIKPILLSCLMIPLLGFGTLLFAQNDAKPETLAEIKATFQQPGRDFSTGPLWTWNDLLTEEQIRSTMQDMAMQHVKQVWVHPRPGLMTPYLGDDWFRLWGIALDEAEKLDMNVWIYDENSYPSGFAGGFVPEAMPESRGMGLHLQEQNFEGTGTSESGLHQLNDPNIWYVWRAEPSETSQKLWVCVYKKSEKTPEPPQLGPGKYMVGKIQLAGSGGWFGGWWYVDLLRKGVTEKFIEVTLEPYRKRFEEQFGKRLPGWFTDEPHLQTAGGLTWNEEIPVLFEKKFGYSLIDALPSMTSENGDWKRVRHNYQQLLLDLFIERWAKPCHDYCEKHNLEFTGHYWEHGWPGASHGPDNMAMYAWHQRPAIDILMNQYNEGVNAQFGNARSCKELGSVANQMGYKRTLSETYGAGGWDLRFEDMKRIADWEYALGVNTNNEHLSYVTLRGARKRDHPQSFSYHTPWWEGYHTLADYNTRLSYALTRGEQINHVLVLEPTTTAWMYQGSSHLQRIGDDFQNLVNQLERWQCEYDLGSEDIIARWGKVENGKFVVNKRTYDLVILPPNMENINGKVIALLQQYTEAGGKLMSCGSLPERVDGVVSETPKLLKSGIVTPDVAAFEAMQRTGKDGFDYANLEIPKYKTTRIVYQTLPEKSVADAKPIGKVFHHRRRVDGGEILFLCNTDINSRAVGSVASNMKGVEQWCLETGKTLDYAFQKDGEKISFKIDLPACGSLLLFLSNQPVAAKARQDVVAKMYQPLGEPKVKRLEPNVLTLDYVDVKVGDEVRKDVYTYEANRWIWQKHGFAKDPWDNEVQFKDQLITKTFPSDSGFSATYKFTLADQVPHPLYLVVERADLYAITCNGKSVSVVDGADNWYLDKSFYKVNISAAAKTGANEVSITAKPITMWHALEAAYLIGDFSLEATGKGFAVKASKPLFMVPPSNVADIHSDEIENVAWMSNGVGFAPESEIKPDRSPFVVFDFGGEQVPKFLKVWNYNEKNLTKRGVNQLKVYASKNPDPKNKEKKLIGEFSLKQGSGDGPETLMLTDDRDARRCNYLVFEILSNHNGVTFPIEEPKEGEEPKKFDDNDDAFVGLSEVKVFQETGSGGIFEVKDLKIASVSSELVFRSFERSAKHLVDGSGLRRPEQGWNAQGMPFYAAGVAYTETFDLGNAELNDNGRFVVSLKKWYGSVAKVIVNGQTASYIGHAPWECDITAFVKDGKNEISVVVIGTLKNTLGPHHAGSPRGTAWPGMFFNAPKDGPPSGNSYDVIGYGLFEPFVVFKK